MPATPTPPASPARLVFRALNRVVVPAVRAGLGSPLPVGAGLVVLETKGRVSGRSRQVPLMATRVGSSVRVGTLRPGSQWAKNLQADPDAAVWVHGHRRPATGTVGRATVGRGTVGPGTVGRGAITTASLSLDLT